MAIPMRKPEAVPTSTTIEDVLIRGDLSKLNEQQRTEYYLRLCNSIGLNPMTQPFQYLTLNGKLVLYARRDCADQLRKINGISIEIVSQDRSDGLLSVHVRAKDKDGRMDEDLGVVAFNDNLRGEAAANAILKAVTKAKRRVTLSLSGLGFLDETEVADIPASAKIEAKDPGGAISDEQLQALTKTIADVGADVGKFCTVFKIESPSELPASRFDEAIQRLEEYGRQQVRA